MNLFAVTRGTGVLGQRLLRQTAKQSDHMTCVFEGVAPEITAKCRFQEKVNQMFTELRNEYKQVYESINGKRVYASEEEITNFFNWLNADEKRLLLMLKYKNKNAGFVFGQEIPFIPSALKRQKDFLTTIEKNPELEAIFDSLDGKFNMSLQPENVLELLGSRPKQIKDFSFLVERAGTVGIDRRADEVILDELSKNNKLVKNLLRIKNSDGKYILTDSEIAKLNEITINHKDLIEKLANKKEYQFLLKAVDEKNIELFRDDKLIEAILKNANKNAEQICINGTINNCHLIQQVKKNGVITNSIIELKLENGVYKAYKDEFVIHSENLKNAKKELFDGDRLDITIRSDRRVLTQKDKTNEAFNMNNPIYQAVYPEFKESYFEKTLMDASGKVKRTKIIEEAEVPGQYNMTTYIGGKENPTEVIQDATAKFYGTKKQAIKVERHFTSPSGTKTDYRVIQGPKGSGMDYVIQDSEGKVIAKLTRRSRQLSENHYTSTLNGEKYDIKFDGNNVTVSKFDKDGNFIEIIKLDEKQLDPKLNGLYRKLPGDYFFALRDAQCNTKYGENLWESIIHHNAYTSGKSQTQNANIEIHSGFSNNGFIFSHELGHIKDTELFHNLRENNEIKDTFMRNWRTSHEQSSVAESKLIAYFSPVGTMFSNAGGAGESIGEAEGLFSGLLNTEFNGTGMRTIIFQQDQADTIAKIANIFYKKV